MSQSVLVVDDSPFVRRILSDWIKATTDLRVVGCASNGNEAVQMTRELRPDVVTLDIEMPERDGLSALEEIMRTCPTPVLMVSSLTTQGAAATIKALELGAYDFVAKPQGSTSLRILSTKDELLDKIRHARFIRLGRAATRPVPTTAIKAKSDKVVVIAASTGGPRALAALWEGLPKGFPAPILIVQHMPVGFTDSFAKRLDGIGTVPCKEASERDHVTPGLALLAPGGKHMTVRPGGIVHLTEEPSLHGVRPAADYLFLTAGDVYGSRVVGAVLTGMGRDGAEGAAVLRKKGATIFGECEASCTIYGMPKAAMQAGGIISEHPIHDMASVLVEAVAGRLAHAS